VTDDLWGLRGELPPPLDDKAFNDPEAWGYCNRCHFLVAVKDGLRVEHRIYRIDKGDTCKGSLEPPVTPVPTEVDTTPPPSLYKVRSRAHLRAMWLRQRVQAREAARLVRVEQDGD
jgi:hypothetical protein